MQWVERVADFRTGEGRTLDRLVYALIIWSIITFTVETLPKADRYRGFFLWSECIVVGVFSLEFVLRAIANGRKYFLSFFGIVDLLAILPFYISLGAVDLRVIRVLRLMRLLRLAKLQRYGTAWQRLALAFSEVKDELVVYGMLKLFLLFVASAGIYYCEHDAQPETFSSILHSMWWAVATLSTVGYGDAYPVTALGKAFTGFVLILGLGVVAVPSGLIASALVKHAKGEEDSGR